MLKKFALLLSAFAVSAGCSIKVRGRTPVATATAALSDASGRAVGTARMWQEEGGLVHVDVVVAAMPSGSHGIHFHSVGRCDDGPMPPFTSAGDHYNPLGRAHGLQNAAGPHAGDAPNLSVATGGQGRLSFTTGRVTLTGGPVSLMDADGSAVVVHAGSDDQASQPAGNSGSRIACGVVQL
ncbi:MAG TPA: superoxide dismutase family protein, partial [Gemmatimonadaceae bacterium]|nr:superoxide dismutase family protein [Gemmatimonadaceae bacterium]